MSKNDLSGRLDRGLLAAVSRSFYLSMRFLPGPLRAPVSLAYLLARATDTVADAAARPVAERVELLTALRDRISGADKSDGIVSRLGALAEFVRHEGERVLLQRIAECLAALDHSQAEDRASIQRVLEIVAGGQLLDLERFPDQAVVRALPDAESLEDYAWRVAGCVGEFWTVVMLRHCPHAARVPAEELHRGGIVFGNGLQFVNILRDLPRDLREGRCYLPLDELIEAGLDVRAATEGVQIPDKPEGWRPFHAVRRKWLAKARAGMEGGIRYACGLRGFRLRFAVLLPALIGRETLDLLEAQPDDCEPAPAKITRKAVKRLMARAVWASVRGKV